MGIELTERRPEQGRIDRLPAWVRDYIEQIERERETAIRTLRQMEDRSTETPYSFEHNPCTGYERGPSAVRSFVDAPNGIVVASAGVRVSVYATEDGIRLSYGADRSALGDALLRPTSYQQFEIVHPSKARL